MDEVKFYSSVVIIVICEGLLGGCYGDPAAAMVPLTAQSVRGRPTQQQQTAGCWFGENDFYQLQESWHPVLEPIGKMVCIVCTCHPVFKKGRLSQEGNVDCQNIGNACPVVTCQDAELLPGKCCKSCPKTTGKKKPILAGGGALSGGISGDMTSEESRVAMGDQATTDHRHFLALLVGKTRRTRGRTRGAGSARLSLIGQHLTYAIHLSKVTSPTAVWFVEEHGTLLHEISLTHEDMRPADSSNSYKVCGTWADIPSIYTRYLQSGKLYMVIVTQERPQGEISGHVRPHTAIQEETFSSVLTPSRRDGSGALAVMSYDTTGSIGILVLHSGVGERKRSVNATLIFSRKRKSIARFPVTIMPQETEITGVWIEPSRSYMKNLIRGRVEFALVKNRRLSLRGEVVPRLTCHVLHAILTTQDTDSSQTQDRHRDHNSLTSGPSAGAKSNRRLNESSAGTKSSLRQNKQRLSGTGAGAVVTLTVTEKGKLDFVMKYSGLENNVTTMTITERFRPAARPICSVPGRSLPGSGSCGSLQVRHLQSLYRGQLAATIRTSGDPPSVLSGPVEEVAFNHGSFQSGVDIVLTGSEMNPSVTTSLVGHAWLSVTPRCALHFTVLVSGFHEDGVTWMPYLRDRLDDHTYVSSLFTGNTAQGQIRDLPPELFKRLSVGLVVFGVSTTRHAEGEISSNVTLLSECAKPMKRDRPSNESPLNDDVAKEDVASLPHGEDIMTINQCSRNGIVYDDGQTWIPVDAPCSTCSCSRGVAHCQEVVCPHVTCAKPIDVPGDCCPHCPPFDSSSDYELPEAECYFAGDKRKHRHGTVFHPYVMPFGYQKCAVCSCSSTDDEVVCAQLPCPELPCANSVAVRKNPDDCCKQCPDGATLQQEQPIDDNPFTHILNMQTACSYRGKTYADGSEWHPRLASFSAHESCVKCTCKAGKVSCARKVCADLPCGAELQVKPEGQCCAHCIGS